MFNPAAGMLLQELQYLVQCILIYTWLKGIDGILIGQVGYHDYQCMSCRSEVARFRMVNAFYFIDIREMLQDQSFIIPACDGSFLMTKTLAHPCIKSLVVLLH